MLVPGPKSPGNNIDVYFRPLIDELKELWTDGVETSDAKLKKNFTLHALLLWTINDFLHMQCYLVGAPKGSLHVRIATRIQTSCGSNTGPSIVTWDIAAFCQRNIGKSSFG